MNPPFKTKMEISANFVTLSEYIDFIVHNELLLSGLAPRPGPSHLVQSGSIGVNRWREAGKVPRLFASWSLCQPLPHKRVRA